MANVVVVGSQWGDEGKGKIVDWLSSRADVVARFQGGHNAGHTLVVDGTTYKLSLLPSGIVRGGKLSVIGNGVVLDPWAFLDEVKRIKGQGVKVNPDCLQISESTALILPIPSELDGIRENRADGIKIGTTKRGIGPPMKIRSHGALFGFVIWRMLTIFKLAWKISYIITMRCVAGWGNQRPMPESSRKSS